MKCAQFKHDTRNKYNWNETVSVSVSVSFQCSTFETKHWNKSETEKFNTLTTPNSLNWLSFYNCDLIGWSIPIWMKKCQNLHIYRRVGNYANEPKINSETVSELFRFKFKCNFRQHFFLQNSTISYTKYSHIFLYLSQWLWHFSFSWISNLNCVSLDRPRFRNFIGWLLVVPACMHPALPDRLFYYGINYVFIMNLWYKLIK